MRGCNTDGATDLPFLLLSLFLLQPQSRNKFLERISQGSNHDHKQRVRALKLIERFARIKKPNSEEKQGRNKTLSCLHYLIYNSSAYRN